MISGSLLHAIVSSSRAPMPTMVFPTIRSRALDPVNTRMVPLPRLLDDVLAAARPHAAALDAVEELDEVRMLVLDPEPRRQERLAASAGVPQLVADLAARFSA